jgi:hypothetical protein
MQQSPSCTSNTRTATNKANPITLHEGSRSRALDGGRRSTPLPGRFSPGERSQFLTVKEADRTPGPVWAGAKNCAPTRIRFPDCPECSKALFWLRCSKAFKNVAGRHILRPLRNPEGVCLVNKCQILDPTMRRYNHLQFSTDPHLGLEM